MTKIQIEISPAKLKKMCQLAKKEYGFEILNPEAFLTTLLQGEADCIDIYLDETMDGGGNSIGDVLSEKQMVGVVKELD